jgi:DNA primase
MIKQSSIDNLRTHIVIEDVIGEFVQLKKHGANYSGCCPFHNEKTASFTVSPGKDIYKCFRLWQKRRRLPLYNGA